MAFYENTIFGDASVPLGSVFDSVQAQRHVQRNQLVSRLLADRKVLRLISAPAGFGKTQLMWEYATRMFPGGHVMWVDGSSPSFISGLDRPVVEAFFSNEPPALLVIDDLPYLDEMRAYALSCCVDMWLECGIEVMVATVPSHESLAARQPDRVFLHPSDLFVSQVECQQPHSSASGGSSRMLQAWKRAKDAPLGLVPSVFWAVTPAPVEDCLRGFFTEQLPHELLRAAFVILLLGKGKLSDLARLGFGLPEELRRILIEEYPFFALDAMKGSFDVLGLPIESLRGVVAATPLDNAFDSGMLPYHERVLNTLFDRGDERRAVTLITAFCSDARCLSWLEERGWALIDGGRFDLVEILLAACGDAPGMESPLVLAMRAWKSGLMGSMREASRHACRALEAKEGQKGYVRLAAYLALLAFDQGGPLVVAKEQYQSEGVPGNSCALLLAVVNAMNAVELERGVCVDDVERSAELQHMRSDAGPTRVKQLQGLLTQEADRVEPDVFSRLALHLLCFVDAPELQPLVRELGCDCLMRTQANGLATFTEALVVRDLWSIGYFSGLDRRTDRRYAELLVSAGNMLKSLAEHAGYANAVIPWEDADAPVVVQAAPRGRAARKNRPETMHVRVFGGLDVRIGDESINLGCLRAKARLVFIELVLAGGHDVPRDEILESVWPNMSRTRALDNFYTAWSNLSAQFGDTPYISRTNDFCRVDRRNVRIDAVEFEKEWRVLLTERRSPQMHLEVYSRLRDLYSSGLLPGERNSITVDRRREYYRDIFIKAMVDAVDCALEANRIDFASHFALDLCRLKERRESVYRALMRVKMAEGERAEAIRTYVECCEFLNQEFGLDPSLEMKDMYDKLVTIDPSLLQLIPPAYV